MVYYLGRDVAVYIAAEIGNHVYVTSSHQIGGASSGTAFARERTDATAATAKVSDLTGVDVGLGATDEDVAYIGQRTSLKAEIKKETTISLTKKKSDSAWATIWNGDGYNSGRWGVSGNVTAGTPGNSYTGLEKPTVNYGYRLHVMLKSGTEILCVQNCTVTSYSVSVNPDGITEETMEFTSQVTPRIVTTGYTTVTGATEL